MNDEYEVREPEGRLSTYYASPTHVITGINYTLHHHKHIEEASSNTSYMSDGVEFLDMLCREGASPVS